MDSNISSVTTAYRSTGKLKILHIVLTLEVGGLENGVVNLVNALKADRYSSIICCIKYKGILASKVDQKRVGIYELKHYKGFGLRLVWELYNIIKKEGIDIVHTRNYKPFVLTFLPAKMAGAAVVHSEHGKDYPFDKKKMRLQKLLSYKTDAIIALSRDIKSCMAKHVGIRDTKVTVIINGVDTNVFRPRENTSIRERLGYGKDDFLVGTVGRIVDIKNHPELIAAFVGVQRTHPQAKLLVVGDGPEFHSLAELIKSEHLEGSVRLLGARQDIPDIISAFDLYVSTSKNEGISNTILEAMSCGVPVIASNVGGNPEIVPDREVGNIYNLGDIEELVSSITHLMDNEDERRRYGKNARKRVERNYSLRTMIEAYSNIYELVAK